VSTKSAEMDIHSNSKLMHRRCYLHFVRHFPEIIVYCEADNGKTEDKYLSVNCTLNLAR